MTYVNIDDRERIIGWNPNNLSGNSDWARVPEKIRDPITEEHGVPIYKYQNGHAVARTAEEINADIPAPVPPTPDRLDVIEQRLDEQDDALIELAALIGGE
jgi:hypothetical protein